MYYDNDNNIIKFHDAGYDAFCTGCVFANQIYQLMNQSNDNLSTTTTTTNILNHITSPKLQLAMNKTFMLRSLFHMNLQSGEENGIIKYTGDLLHVTNFPITLKTDDIFSTCVIGGIAPEHIEVIWINDLSFIIRISELSEKSYTSIVFPSEWCIKPLSEFFNPPVVEEMQIDNIDSNDAKKDSGEEAEKEVCELWF
jgi:hypothetical protein